MRYCFADCELDTERVLLSRAGYPIALQRQGFKVLAYLLEHRGRLVLKDELAEHVWQAAITDTTIESCIKKVRQAVGDTGRAQRIIATRFGYGYEFVAPVVVCSKEAGEVGPLVTSSPLASPAPGLASVASEADPLTAVLSHAPLTPSTPAGEKKVVTVLCCGVHIPSGRRPGAALDQLHSQMRVLYNLLQQAVSPYGGRLQPVAGTRILVVFGVPVAQEDHAQRAMLAALSLQQQCSTSPHALQIPGEEALAVSMGLHTGEVAVGGFAENQAVAATVVGETVLVATALQEAAAPGTMLGSAATARLVQSLVDVEPMPPMVLVRQTTVQVYKILRRRTQLPLGVPPQRRPLSRFVGRVREFAALQALLTQVEAGQGQVGGIMGEPGMGKTRLLYEFRRSLEPHRVTYVESHCQSYASAVPYVPLRALFRYICSIIETDSPEAMDAKVCATLQQLTIDLEESAPYLRHFLGLPAGTDRLTLLTPEAVKLRTFALLRQVNLASSQQRPLLIVVENLHWIDPSSEDYLVSLVEVLASAPVFLLVTFRPGYRPPWMEKSYATQIALSRLTPQDSLTVVRGVLSLAHFPHETTQRILDKAEGNPFFLEELAQAVHEHGALYGDMPIPDTIQGVLMARIDRLAEETKRVVQTAAVLGRTASVRLLEAVWATPDTLAPHLQELQRLELLYEQPGGAEPAYVFKHALTQDVAYGSLLQEQRQVLHQKAGEALETLYADHLEAIYDRLAYHYARTARADKAVEYLTHLAEQAQREHAHTEAVTILQEAHTQVEHLSAETRGQRAIKLVVLQAESLYALGRHREGVALLRQEQSRQECLQNPTLAGPYYFWLSFLSSNLGEHEPASQNAQRALAAAQQCGDEITMGKTCYVLSRESVQAGQYQQGVTYSQQGVALLEKAVERYWLGLLYVTQASSYAYLGDLAAALRAAERAAALGDAIEHRVLQSRAANEMARNYAQMRAWDAAIAAGQRALAAAPDAISRAIALRQLGDIYVYQGDHARAVPLLEEAVRQADQIGHRLLRGNGRTALSEAYLLDGDIAKARDLAQQALKIAENPKLWTVISIALRALGRIAQAEGDFLEAQRCFTEALQVCTATATAHQAARLHICLATLAHAQGQPETAATHLQEAHGLFSRVGNSRNMAYTEQLARDLGVELSW